MISKINLANYSGKNIPMRGFERDSGSGVFVWENSQIKNLGKQQLTPNNVSAQPKTPACGIISKGRSALDLPIVSAEKRFLDFRSKNNLSSLRGDGTEYYVCTKRNARFGDSPAAECFVDSEYGSKASLFLGNDKEINNLYRKSQDLIKFTEKYNETNTSRVDRNRDADYKDAQWELRAALMKLARDKDYSVLPIYKNTIPSINKLA
ncbi:hypothetical protein IJG72_03695 [bacterium]|nr:hypothetical protein [bacterium]